MKYLRKFNEAKSIEDFNIEVVNGGPSNNSGGVQIDMVTILVNGEDEYQFEVASLINGTIQVRSLDGYGDVEDKNGLLPENSELNDFLSVNDDSCIGDSTEIDGHEIEIIDFSHNGGMEEGYLKILIDDEEIQFFIQQDATGMDTSIYVEFLSDEDEEKAKKVGLEMNADLEDYIYHQYDRWCNEHR